MFLPDSINTNYLVVIAGGSCSGKTSLANALKVFFNSTLIFQDSFYCDQSQRFNYDGGAVNFDHPDAIDWRLLELAIKQLLAGVTVDIPFYNFATHKREQSREQATARPVIILDGTLVLNSSFIRSQACYKIFLDIPVELRRERRIIRDQAERGRELQGIMRQFDTQVEPMHQRFVDTSKQYADLVIDQKQIKSRDDYAVFAQKISAKLSEIFPKN